MQRTNAPRFNDVAELLPRVAADHVAPGLAAAAVVDGELAHVAVHGWRDVAGQETAQGERDET